MSILKLTLGISSQAIGTMGTRIEASPFTVGDWTVEPNLGRIRRNDESNVLEPRIMDLLVYLANHAGETISTDELAQEVWAGRAITDAPVYQGIAQLRKALEDEARHPRYISTVTKKGYRLIATVEVPEPEPRAIARPMQPRQRSRYWAPALALFLAGSYLFLSSSDVSVSRIRDLPAQGQFNSIAILPFMDMSADGSQQYLGDGIAEELIHRIAAVPDVQVVARTSSFSFRDGSASVQEIGARLSADVILEGSVRSSGDRLRITAQLVNATDGYHIWSQTFEPVPEDVLDIQDQIARNVTQLLQTSMEGAGDTERSWTYSAKAAEAYYLGMFHMRKRRADSVLVALDYFKQAVSDDPQFALAWAAMARTYLDASEDSWGEMPAEDALRESQAALRVAESIDGELPEVLMLKSRKARERGDVDAAEAFVQRVIEINPSYAPAHSAYGRILVQNGRQFEKALLSLKKAVELDPISNVHRLSLGYVYMYLNRPEQAIAETRTAVELDPDWHAGYANLANWLAEAGHIAEAMEIARKAITVEGMDARLAGTTMLGLAYGYLTLGEYTVAEEWYRKAEELDLFPWGLANHRLHLLLAQSRYDDVDSLLTYWENSDLKHRNIVTASALYRSVIGEDERAFELLIEAENLPLNGNESNLLIPDFLVWGYIPAVHFARLKRQQGELREAEQLLEESQEFIASFRQDPPGLPGFSYVRASIHAIEGERELALTALSEAIDSGYSTLWFIERDPVFASYRGDPAFESLVDRIRQHLAEEKLKLEAAPIL